MYIHPRNNPVPWRKRDQGGCRKCHGCGKKSHLEAQCPRTRCFECGNEGQIARRCPYKYRRKAMGLGVPMEVNVQKVRRRRGPHRPDESSSDVSEVSERSGTDVEDGETRQPSTSSKNGEE
nr:uncharacterized protein LOC112211692 [Halyomorpha halys]